jgi:hypothetical protein
MAIKETIKNLFGKVLSIGTPPEKKVLYKEVIKQKAPKESAEKLLLDDIKNSVKKVFKSKEEDVKPTPETKKTPKKPVTKKKAPSKKSTAKKTTTTGTKKKPTTKAKTTSTPDSKKAPAKKPVANKVTEKKTTVKKETKKTVAKKSPSTKTTTAKKKSATPAKTTEKKTTVKKATVKKKVATKTTTVTKKSASTTKKTTTPTKGSKKAEKIALYIKDIQKHYGEVDEDFVAIIVKNLGPSIYRRDAELVSCSDPKELDTVRRNFLIKKLGIDASQGVLDAAIQDVCEELKGVRTKYRATFYYSLAKKFKKESVLS